MPAIEDGIGRIHRWLRNHSPHREALLQPPLTRQQIDDLVGPTGVLLPDEAYVLYEWHNGIDDRQSLFPGYQFNPLGNALEDLNRYYRDEFLRGPDQHTWLFIFQTQYTFGGYALFCDSKPRATAPIDYDATNAVTDSLTELLTMISNQFEEGAYVVDEEDDLDFADPLRPANIGMDRDKCYNELLDQDWEAVSQAVLRIGFQVAAQHEKEFALNQSLRMFRNPSSRIWREPLILRDLMIQLNFSTDPEAHEMMARLLQHPDRRIRWRAADLVGNIQDFHRYQWVRPMADYLAEELASPELPAPYRANLILTFGKTGDRHAIPLLQQLRLRHHDMIGVVAQMCLERVYGLRA